MNHAAYNGSAPLESLRFYVGEHGRLPKIGDEVEIVNSSNMAAQVYIVCMVYPRTLEYSVIAPSRQQTRGGLTP